MKVLLLVGLLLGSQAAHAENALRVNVKKDSHGKKIIEIKEDNSGGRTMVTMMFRSEVASVSDSLRDQYLIMSMGDVAIPDFQVPGQCRVSQFGQSNASLPATSINVGVFVEGNGCEAVAERLKKGNFQVTFKEAHSGVGEDLSPVVLFVNP